MVPFFFTITMHADSDPNTSASMWINDHVMPNFHPYMIINMPVFRNFCS